jgi:archaeosine-15-forming tRNA-guanine transglycosylase
MLKISKRDNDYMLTIIDKTRQKLQYIMTNKEYKNLVLKGWEEFVRTYCKFAKLFCQYDKKIRPYIDKFCQFTEDVCNNLTVTITRKK